jgi:hypothetical protein
MNSSAFGLLCLGVGGLPPAQAVAANPDYKLPEIHLNIWERKEWWPFAKLKAFLDIGLMFDIEETLTSVEVILPWSGREADLRDLYSRVANTDGIAAVFNEGWVISYPGNEAMVAAQGNPEKNFAIVHVFDTQGGPRFVKPTTHGNHKAVTIDVQALRARAKNAIAQAAGVTVKRFYLRFRILAVEREFYCVGESEKLRGLAPVWQRTDVIDFRVNVRRGVPQGIENTVKGWFLEFSKVQLFLMRTRDQDIIFHDRLFMSCRSLEDEEFWGKYADEPTVSKRDIVSLVKRSLGYHWKDSQKTSGGVTKFVTEFATLARFKIVEFGWLWFLIAAVLLGALGNGVWEQFKGRVYDPTPSGPPAQAVCVNAEDMVTQARQACAPSAKKELPVQRKGNQ